MTIARTSLLAAALLASTALPALAQTRAETLRHVTGAAINTLDPNIPGSTREAFGLSLLTYDRLLSFGKKQLDGKWVLISTPSSRSWPRAMPSAPTA